MNVFNIFVLFFIFCNISLNYSQLDSVYCVTSNTTLIPQCDEDFVPTPVNITIYNSKYISPTSIVTFTTGVTNYTGNPLCFNKLTHKFNQVCQIDMEASYFNGIYSNLTYNDEPYIFCNAFGSVSNVQCSVGGYCYCDLLLMSHTSYVEGFGNMEEITNISTISGYLVSGATYWLGVSDPAPFYAVVSIQDTTLKIITSVNDEYYVFVRKDGFDKRITIVGTENFIKLEDDYFMVSGELEVIIISKNGFSVTKLLNIVAFNRCRMYDCIFCTNAIDNWHCLSLYYKFVIVFILILLSMFIIRFLPGTFFILYSAGYVLIYAPLKWMFLCLTGKKRTKMMKDLNNKIKNKYTNLYDYAFQQDPADDELTETDSNNQEPLLPKSKNKRTRINLADPSTLAIFLLICVTTTFAHQCTDGLSINSQDITCIKLNSSYEQCQLKTSFTTTIKFKGTSSCLDVIDPKTSSSIAQLFINYDEFIEKYPLELIYYTSDRTLFEESQFRCLGAGQCKEQNCNKIYPNDKSALGELKSGAVRGTPGISKCFRGTKAGAACVLSDLGCTFTGFGLWPSEHIATVYSPLSSINVISVSADFVDNLNKTTNLFVDQIHDTASNSLMSISLIGAFNYIPVELNNKKVIAYNQFYYFHEASDQNSPKVGLIGDIQAETASQLKYFSSNSFIFDPKIVTEVQGSYMSRYYIETSKLKSLSQKDRLPNSFDNSFYNISNGNLEVIPTYNPSILLQVKFNQPITFMRHVDVICPKSSFISVSGCYNCKVGSVIVIKSKSLCSPGLVTLSADEDYITMMTRSLMLGTVDDDYFIYFHTSKSSNSFELELTGNGAKEKIKIQFEAYEDVDLETPEFEEGIDPNLPKEGSIWASIQNFFTKTIPKFLDDIFKGVASWWKYIIFVIIAVIIFIIGLGTLTYISKMIGFIKYFKSKPKTN